MRGFSSNNYDRSDGRRDSYRGGGGGWDNDFRGGGGGGRGGFFQDRRPPQRMGDGDRSRPYDGGRMMGGGGRGRGGGGRGRYERFGSSNNGGGGGGMRSSMDQQQRDVREDRWVPDTRIDDDKILKIPIWRKRDRESGSGIVNRSVRA